MPTHDAPRGWPFYSSPPHPAHPFQPSYFSHHESDISTAGSGSATVIEFPGPSRSSRIDACDRLLTEFVARARRGHALSMLRPAFSAIAAIEETPHPLDGFSSIAAAVVLEAAFAMTRTHLHLPPRQVLFAPKLTDN
jgi:hypothetical protein